MSGEGANSPHRVQRCGPVTDYLGVGPDGSARCVCVHGKEWPEGDMWESHGGAACEECSRAALAEVRANAR